MPNHYGNFGELAEAVFAGDLSRAEDALNAMHREGEKEDAIRRAKRRANPSLRPQIETPREVFPKPGHAVGSMLGIPKMEKDREAAR